MSCVMAIREERLRLVAGGMFDMGIQLIPSVSIASTSGRQSVRVNNDMHSGICRW